MNTHPTPAEHVREWFQKVWNERDDSAIDRMLSAKIEIEGISINDTSVLRGPEEFRVFRRALLAAFPDFHVEVTHVIEQGDWASARFVCEGTHSGDALGMPATNKRVRFTSLAFGRVEDGQWVEGWNLIDVTALTQQIGGPMRFA